MCLSHINVSLPLFLPLFPSLKIIKERKSIFLKMWRFTKFIANILSDRCNCQSVKKQYFIKRALKMPDLLVKASLEIHTFHMLMSGG